MWSDVILTRRKIVKMPQSVEKNATKTGKEFWLALASIGGIGPIQIRYLLREFETLEAAFSADLTEIARLPMFDSLLAAKLQKARIGLSDLRRHIDWYESQGIQVITWQEATYPEQLKQISNAPVALACRGANSSYSGDPYTDLRRCCCHLRIDQLISSIRVYDCQWPR